MKPAQLAECRAWLERALVHPIPLLCDSNRLALAAARTLHKARRLLQKRGEYHRFDEVIWTIHGNILWIRRSPMLVEARQRLAVRQRQMVVETLVLHARLAAEPASEPKPGPPPSLDDFSFLERREAGDDEK
jgi:hypothetical protein